MVDVEKVIQKIIKLRDEYDDPVEFRESLGIDTNSFYDERERRYYRRKPAGYFPPLTSSKIAEWERKLYNLETR